MSRILAITPTYNEILNIGDLIDSIYSIYSTDSIYSIYM